MVEGYALREEEYARREEEHRQWRTSLMLGSDSGSLEICSFCVGAALFILSNSASTRS